MFSVKQCFNAGILLVFSHRALKCVNHLLILIPAILHYFHILFLEIKKHYSKLLCFIFTTLAVLDNSFHAGLMVTDRVPQRQTNKKMVGYTRIELFLSEEADYANKT